jgi:hypothetical protein
MAALAILVGIGFFGWLLYGAAIYTLPFLVGASVGLRAEQAGASPLGGIMLGIGAGALVLVVGRAVFARAGPARRDRIGLRGSSRARWLFCDVDALWLGFRIRRLASGLCDPRGNSNWRHRLAKACRNATACRRRQSAAPAAGAGARRAAPRGEPAPPTSLGVNSSVVV